MKKMVAASEEPKSPILYWYQDENRYEFGSSDDVGLHDVRVEVEGLQFECTVKIAPYERGFNIVWSTLEGYSPEAVEGALTSIGIRVMEMFEDDENPGYYLPNDLDVTVEFDLDSHDYLMPLINAIWNGPFKQMLEKSKETGNEYLNLKGELNVPVHATSIELDCEDDSHVFVTFGYSEGDPATLQSESWDFAAIHKGA